MFSDFLTLAFCVASPPILIAFSVALLAIFDAEEENIDQPCKINKYNSLFLQLHFKFS